MSKSYRRRYYRRRSSTSSQGVVGLAVVAALVISAYGSRLNRALVYAAIVGLAVLALVVAVWLGRKWKARAAYAAASLAEIDAMSGIEFEKYVADLLRRQGYTGIKLTERYDLGVDIIARKDGVTWGIQVKRSSGMVKAAAIRQVVTALKHYNCDRAMVITNATYSRPAVELARSNSCVLIDRSLLTTLAHNSAQSESTTSQQ